MLVLGTALAVGGFCTGSLAAWTVGIATLGIELGRRAVRSALGVKE